MERIQKGNSEIPEAQNITRHLNKIQYSGERGLRTFSGRNCGERVHKGAGNTRSSFINWSSQPYKTPINWEVLSRGEGTDLEDLDSEGKLVKSHGRGRETAPKM